MNATTPTAAASKALPLAPTDREVQHYLFLVHQTVAGLRRRLPPSVQRDDLFAAGVAGLFDALCKDTTQRGPAFEGYARIRIRGAIMDELRTQDWLTRRARKSERAESEKVGGSTRPGVVSLDDLSEHGRDAILSDDSARSPERQVDLQMSHAAVAKAMQQLPERERSIVDSHYFHDLQLKTIAGQLGVSEPRVSQLHARAIGRLRTILVEPSNTAA